MNLYSSKNGYGQKKNFSGKIFWMTRKKIFRKKFFGKKFFGSSKKFFQKIFFRVIQKFFRVIQKIFSGHSKNFFKIFFEFVLKQKWLWTDATAADTAATTAF